MRTLSCCILFLAIVDAFGTPDAPTPQSEVLPLQAGFCPVETVQDLKFFDPHNHLGGIPHFMGIGLTLGEPVAAASALVASPAFQDLMAALGTNPSFKPVYNPDEPLLYIYQFFVEGGKMGSVQVEHIATYIPSLRPVLDDLEALRQLILVSMRDALVADAKLGKDAVILGWDWWRMQPGSRTLYPLIECLPDLEGEELYLVLSQILTAGPFIDFDTSYVVRGFLVEVHGNETLVWGMTVQTLIDSEITSVELSNPLHKIPHPDAASVVTEHKWNSGGLCQRMWDFFHADERVANFVEIKWLPMYLGSLLAEVDPSGNTMRQTPDGCAPDGSTRRIYNPAADELVSQLLTLDHVVGVDYASQENFCMVPFGDGTGAENFESQVAMILEKAIGLNKRLVVHVHTAEGFPLFDYKYLNGDSYVDPYTEGGDLHDPEKVWGMSTSKHEAMCAAAKSWPVTEEDARFPFMMSDGLPVHFETARSNGEVLMDNWIEIRARLSAKYPDFDNFLVLRLGHGTHLDTQTVDKMAANKASVDINLSSNLATMSYPKRPEPASIHSGFYKDPIYQTTFYEHVLLELMARGVFILLGTDGEGVENSEIRREYIMADEELKLFTGVCHAYASEELCAVYSTDGIGLPAESVNVNTLYG